MDPTQVANQLTLQSALKGTTAVLPLLSGVALCVVSVFGFWTSHVNTRQKTDDNAAAILQLKADEIKLQLQIEQQKSLEAELKNLEDQNKETQSAVVDMGKSLQEFEARFLVIPTPYSPQPRPR